MRHVDTGVAISTVGGRRSVTSDSELNVLGEVGVRRVCLLSVALLMLSCAVSFDNWPDPIRSSAGGSGATNGTGGVGPTGGASSEAGGTGGVDATGGATATVATGGQASMTTLVWLTLDHDQAKSTSPPNDSLGINGRFYAYSDSCASFTFDPSTRCVVGMLCDVGAQYENWGVAMGFDFDYTGSTGTPANAALTWNPDAHNAVGVAWHITNLSTSMLQLWVLNMDPSYNGTCTSDSCSIDGPPDGNDQITPDGTLYFSSMKKDTWNSGINYTYSPAAVYSLQFKIPTVITGAETFEFCVDKLGLFVQ